LVQAGGGGGKGGGGGGSSRTPSTAPDSLDSRQYANVIDLISEGEIEGLADGFKSIYLNNTVLQNPDNSYNFQDVNDLHPQWYAKPNVHPAEWWR
jgi:predicted phage tail protein